jgi:preprotein translocase subunit SecG
VTAILTILHVIICLILIAAVLLQSGKAADLAGAFGGAGSATAFGPRGTAPLMAKITTACAILFMATSISLWLFTTPQRKSRMEGTEPGKPAATQTQNQQGSGPATSTTPDKQAGSGTATSPAGTATTGQPSTTQPPTPKPPEPAKKQL